ncbi:MAG: methyltransferase domain-containing protein [Magnetococcales bacterium]|nr:methyltransferase domain-containing protein [Magnetococcales bacterium]
MPNQLDIALQNIGPVVPPVFGLHCGCGGNWRHNWLNTDLETHIGNNGVQTEPGMIFSPVGYQRNEFYFLQHNALTPFPLPDNCFNNCYSEHFIEHLNRVQGLIFLKEMHRLLRPNGVLRISTPDLIQHAEVLLQPDRPEFAHNVAFLNGRVPEMFTRNRAFMFNQLFYFWGHQWIYDFEDLALLIEQAGFPASSIQRCAYRQGKIADLENLDQEERQTLNLYVEAVKAP